MFVLIKKLQCVLHGEIMFNLNIESIKKYSYINKYKIIKYSKCHILETKKI